jgi:UDP-N-acetylmuramoyl-tripeptide--D-alanyl-D-alanine ligase
MRNIQLEDLLQATQGRIQSQSFQVFQGVGTDTRKNLTNQLFIALKGDSFDAHDYLLKAVEAGARGLLIHTPLEKIFGMSLDQANDLKKRATIVLVEDTLKAFQDLANYYRKKSSALIVGITGSNGKTTTKEFSGAIIGAYKKVHIPKGSFNNHWGVPMTLLDQPEDTEVSVIEMGMNHSGEIRRLCEIAEPEHVVVSMVGRAHVENFGNILGIAAAKEEIYKYARPDAHRIYNLDNPYTLAMYQRARQEYPTAKKILTFSSQQNQADVYLKITELTMSKILIEGAIAGVSGQAAVPVFGHQNLTNLSAAAALAFSIGLTPEQIWRALPFCKTSWGRNQVVLLQNGAQLLFDGYNANPDSMKALLENVPLIKARGKKMGVFAQMRELGAESSQLHQELGTLVSQSGFEVVWFYGDDAEAFEAGMQLGKYQKKLIVSKSYEDSLASEVASMINPSDAVLVKGSRGMKMERFVLACEPEDFTLTKD